MASSSKCRHGDWSFDRTIMYCGSLNCDERMHYWCGYCGISECEEFHRGE